MILCMNRKTVLYNDSCPICSREIAAYRKMSDPDTGPAYAGLTTCDLAQFGLTEDEAARRLHVVQDGQVISGIPAFAALWEDVPRLRWLARLVRLPVVGGLANGVYDHLLAPALFALHKRRQRRG